VCAALKSARARRADLLVRDDEHGLEPVRHLEALGTPVRAQHEAAEPRSGDVVGMALHPGREREHVGV
jgi:hypothetical protein